MLIPTRAMMLLLWGGQGFGLGLDLIQPAVQLPFVGRRRLRLGRKTAY